MHAELPVSTEIAAAECLSLYSPYVEKQGIDFPVPDVVRTPICMFALYIVSTIRCSIEVSPIHVVYTNTTSFADVCTDNASPFIGMADGRESPVPVDGGIEIPEKYSCEVRR